MPGIEKVAVLGAGVMGAQIAAHVANAGLPVVLLDIAKEGPDRSAIARAAVDRLLKMDPAPFMLAANAKRITPGNFDDDLGELARCDWIIEAIIENPKIKSELYLKVDAARKVGSIVSSNTSTIPLAVLTKGQSEAFARDFLITHFFNPPRYLRLLELVSGPQTRPEAVAAIAQFCDVNLGKGVVACKDTPGFIANRIGTYTLFSAVIAAMELGLTVEETDAVMGKPVGFPRTGVFGLLDLIGLDLMPLIAKSLLATLPADDGFRSLYREPPLLQKMIQDGYTGRKGKGGFYRLKVEGGEKIKEAIDLTSGEYRRSEKVKLPVVEAAGKDLRALLADSSKIGKFAWRVLSESLVYALTVAESIAHSPADVDAAMRLGFNWKWGPFELVDKIGAAAFAQRLAAEGRPVPKILQKAGAGGFSRLEGGRLQTLDFLGQWQDAVSPAGVLRLSDVKRGKKPVAKNGSASVWDIGDGVLCLEFHTKMNALDPDSLGLLGQCVPLIAGSKGAYRALVVYNEGENFSAGVNLGLALFVLNVALYPQIEAMVEQGQKVYQAIKYAPFPTVVAPSGLALGGACELMLHASAVQAHAETYTGLVEVGVGLIPGWGGCVQYLARATANNKRPGGPMPPIAQAFETIGTAKVSKSAPEARDLLFLRPTDGITMNRDRLLHDAKQKALLLAQNYVPPVRPEFHLPGPTARAALQMALDNLVATGKATPHDQVVAGALADVLSGAGTDLLDAMSEDDLLALERRSFMQLIRTAGTLARITHMLDTGKPLRN